MDSDDRVTPSHPDTATAELQRETDTILWAISTITYLPAGPLTLAHVLDMVSGGPLPIGLLTSALSPDMPPANATRRFTRAVETLIRLAALRSGTARWHPTTFELVGLDGEPLPFRQMAELALSSPQGTRETTRLLEALGIDPLTVSHYP